MVPSRFHLVISAPQSQTCVVAQPDHIIPGFRQDTVFKARSQIIGIAGIHQILPYHNTVGIAQVIEQVGGIVTAAPYPQAIEMCQICTLDQRTDLFFPDIRIDRIFRDIVCPFRKHLLSVHHETEFLAVLVRLPAYRNGSQSDAKTFFVIDLICFFQGYFHIVQRLGAHPVRPPQLRIMDRYPYLILPFFRHPPGCIRHTGHHRHRLFPGHAHLDLHGDRVRKLNDGIHKQRNFTVDVFLEKRNFPDMRIRKRLDTDLTENPHVRKLRPPVPSKRGLCLTQILSSGQCPGRTDRDLFVWLCLIIFDVLQRRMKMNKEFVRPHMQPVLHLKAVGMVHILGDRQFFSV